MVKPRLRDLLRNAILVLLYSGSAMLGLRMAATGGGYAAPIWLPTGFAAAAILLYGDSMIPGIWIGAYIANFFVRTELTGQNFLLSGIVATGNTLEAVVIRLLLRNFRLSKSFLRMREVIDFIRASVLGPLVSATIGVTAISIAHRIASLRQAATAWETWWIGDALGALVLAPMLIALLSEKPPQRRANVDLRQHLLFVLGLMGVIIAFRFLLPEEMINVFVGMALYSIAIWCGFTLPVRRLFVATALLCAFAITRAYLGLGLFGKGDVVERLALLQFFLGCVTVMIMILNAVVAERFFSDELALEREKALLRSEKMSALGEMSTRIAHEIGNPLLVIYARTEEALNLLGQGKSDPEAIKPLLEKIDLMAERIDQIVRSVRSFSRSSEKDPFRAYPVREILQDTLELCRDRFRKHRIELIVEPELLDDLAILGTRIECKPVLISQVLLNLLNNGLDAVESLPDDREKWVKLAYRALTDSVEFATEDSGPGVPQEIRRDIFKPFFTTKGEGRGTGLGLSIARSIVESHHGALTLDTGCPNARFVVTLPLLQPRPATPTK